MVKVHQSDQLKDNEKREMTDRKKGKEDVPHKKIIGLHKNDTI